VIQHIVLFRFPEMLTDAEFGEWRDLAREWPIEIAGISAVRLGSPMSDTMSEGYQYLLYVELDDLDALNGYLAHPAHGKFGAWAASRGSAFLVFDYEVDLHTVIQA
jgi:Stress responsive A/B Barrel Domain